MDILIFYTTSRIKPNKDVDCCLLAKAPSYGKNLANIASTYMYVIYLCNTAAHQSICYLDTYMNIFER